MNKRIGKNDLLLLGVLLCVCIAVLLVFSFDKGKAGATVVVTVDGKEYGRYDLAKEQKVPIYNDQGEVTNTLLIRDHKADMIDADCRDLLCVKQKAIDRSGETIVCLPNRVVVSVENTGQDALDGFAQ